MRDIEEDEFLKKLGKRIAELRKEKGWTQIEFADLLQIKRTSLTRIELGGTSMSVTMFKKIMDNLGTDINLGQL